jgi:chromosome segregation ATPase
VGKLREDFAQVHEKLEAKSKLLTEAESQLQEKDNHTLQLKTSIATLYNEKEVLASKLAEKERQLEQVESQANAILQEKANIEELLKQQEEKVRKFSESVWFRSN